MRNIKLIGIFSIFESLDFFVPIRILYFQQITHSYSEAAGLVSLIWIFSAILEVPTGIFSDLIGRKKTTVLGSLCLVLGYILYALGINFWVLVLGTFLHGAARAFYSGNNTAYLYNTLENENLEHQYHEFYGKVNALVSGVSVVAALLSGILAEWSYSMMMWISVIPQAIALLITTQLKDYPKHSTSTTNVFAHLKEAILETKNNINLRYLSLASIFGGSGGAAYEFHSAVFGAVWPTWAVGVARAIQEVSSMIGYYYSGKIVRALGEANIIFFQTSFTWIGSLIAVVLRSVFSPLFIIGGFIFMGPYDTATQTLFQKEFTEKQRATIASLNSLGNSLYFALVLYMAGLMANHQGPFVGLLVTQIFYIPVIYFRWKLFGNLRLRKA